MTFKTFCLVLGHCWDSTRICFNQHQFINSGKPVGNYQAKEVQHSFLSKVFWIWADAVKDSWRWCQLDCWSPQLSDRDWEEQEGFDDGNVGVVSDANEDSGIHQECPQEQLPSSWWSSLASHHDLCWVWNCSLQRVLDEKIFPMSGRPNGGTNTAVLWM